MSIYTKQSEDSKTFETAEEFLKYYENNKKDIDELHTRSLNLKFKINGHTIGRKQGKLILYPKKSEQKETFQEQDVTIEQLKQAILSLNERLKKIEEYFETQSHTQSTPSSNFQLYYHK